MFISSNQEILSLMPTAKWSRPELLLSYLDEEERVALEPLLGAALYEYLAKEYLRLRKVFVDLTKQTIFTDGVAKEDPDVPHATVTNALEAAAAHASGIDVPYTAPCVPDFATLEVSEDDMALVKLIRICQQVEFYLMLSHKAGMLSLSFNGGSGFAQVSTEDFEPATKDQIERLVKDSFMSASRSIDSLLIALEDDAKGQRRFTEMWSEADAFYLHTDLLFDTAREMHEYLADIKTRMEYAETVPVIRYVQRMMVAPKVGVKLLEELMKAERGQDESYTPEFCEAAATVLPQLRLAAAFYIEARRPKIARQDSNLDGDRAMTVALAALEELLPKLGDRATGTPIYNRARAREAEEERKEARRRIACQGGGEVKRHRQHGSLFSLGLDVTNKWVPEQNR